MIFEEIKPGTIFNLGNTPSYPKLKTKNGYVDMRDEIVNNNPNQAVLSAEITVMSTEDLMRQFDDSKKSIEEWVDSLSHYLN